MVSLFSQIIQTVRLQSCAFIHFSCYDYLLPTSFVLLCLCVVLISFSCCLFTVIYTVGQKFEVNA